MDTNLWISYLISSRLLAIDRLLEEKKIVLLFSPESLQEFIEVVRRPKFEKFFSEEDVKELLILFDHFGELVKVESEVEVCRDPNDNFLLSLAKDGQADFLITGDKDLLVIQEFEGTRIVTFKEFEEEIKD
ncbi:MAG: putative toxin-antitoxin system toxin component, PIN family [Saprospiraceae bacterium]|nr:putative toxin-antitoxin system toxin component, PIN family [Saprospiraceae bacterium]